MNIVIIGGSRGIGKAAARELLQDGHKVLIVGRNPKTLEETGKELAGAVTYSCNAGKAEETTGLVDAVKNGKIVGFGDNVDGLILCAAVFPNPATKTSVVQPEPEELQAMLDSNVTAYYRLVKEFLPLLAPGSRIVLIGSTSGIRRDRGGIYGISKWALRSYAYALREECKPMGVGVSHQSRRHLYRDQKEILRRGQVTFRDLRPRKSHHPDLPSVPTGSTGGSEYPTFTGRYLLGSRWTAFFLPKETH